MDRIVSEASVDQQGSLAQARAIIARLFQVDNGTLLDGIKPVGNTFVSLTAYQAQGYAKFPIY